MMSVAAMGCDSVDVGRQEDPATFTLVKILIQDEDRVGGRGLLTDILRDPVAYMAKVAAKNECSELEPCLAGQPHCVIAEGDERGYCPDDLNPAQTPVQVGIPRFAGGLQIRLVFNQLPDPALDVQLMGDMMDIISLKDASGAEVESAKYLDPTGDPYLTSFAIGAPYGPALVIKPANMIEAGATYTVNLDPARIKNRKGVAVSNDINGPIMSSYSFTSEALHAMDGIAPDFTADPAVEIAPTDFFQLFLNAAADPESHTQDVVEVKNEAGADVDAIAFVDCEGGPQVLDVVHTSSTGAPLPWDPGMYTIKLTVKSAGGGTIGVDPFGGTLEGSFVVVEDAEPTNPIDALTLPADCGMEM